MFVLVRLELLKFYRLFLDKKLLCCVEMKMKKKLLPTRYFIQISSFFVLQVGQQHRRRLHIEEKAKVVAACLGAGFCSIPCRACHFAPG